MVVNKIYKLFEAGDGREASEHVVSIRKGWYARIYSEGWDCTCIEAEDEVIEAWLIPYVPANECEQAIAVPYMERCQIDCCTSIDVPKLRLTKDRQFDIINDIGTYVLQRKCHAGGVTVYIQYMEK